MRMKFILVIILILVVPAACYAQGETTISYLGDCPHELRVLPMLLADHQLQLGDGVNMDDYSSAQCQYCDMQCILYPWAESDGIPESKNKNCAHVYRKIGMQVAAGWYPVDAVTHEYRMYYHAQCEHCGHVVRYYIVRDIDYENEVLHVWTENWSHAHLTDQNMHMYIASCIKCGYAYGYTTNCEMYDNGLCRQQMLEALRFYGLE